MSTAHAAQAWARAHAAAAATTIRLGIAARAKDGILLARGCAEESVPVETATASAKDASANWRAISTVVVAFKSRTGNGLEGTAALASSKVLATFVVGGGLLLELIEWRRSAGLADGVLTSTALTRAKGASLRGCREADRAGEGGFGTVSGTTIGVDGEADRGAGFLVATAKGVGGWRRKWFDVGRWRG